MKPNRGFGPRTMTKKDDEIRFQQWLFGAREEVVATASVDAVQMMFGRLDPRAVECALLARQGAIERRKNVVLS